MLKDLMGPSWRSTTIGVLCIVMGAFLTVVGWYIDEASLKGLGLGMIPTGILAFVVRDQKASMIDHAKDRAEIREVQSVQAQSFNRRSR